MGSAGSFVIAFHKFLYSTGIDLSCKNRTLLSISWQLEQHDIVGVQTNVSHLFPLMKYILHDIDYRQISVMAPLCEKISNTLFFARLSHKIVQND